MSDNAIIKLAEVEQEFEAAAAVAALEDAGIAASYKATTDSRPLGMLGSLGCPDSFDIFVPSSAADEACEVLIGIGTLPAEGADPADAAVPAAPTYSANELAENECGEADTAEADPADTRAEAGERAEAPQSLGDLMPENTLLAAVYKAVIVVLVLLVIAAVVWLSDAAIAWFMGLLG